MSDPLVQGRLNKLQSLRDRGIEPYPARVPQVCPIGEVVEAHAGLAPEARSGVQATVAGRLVACRKMGKAMFFDLRDGTGRIQIHGSLDGLGEDEYAGLADTDIGDFLAVTGEPFCTRRGELTVGVATWVLLAKSIRPLPEKWHGLKDVELRHRHRALDLIANEDVREGFVRRSRMISALRRTLDSAGFIEVETPSMQPIPGGANARPFTTHHNALGCDLYLRVALELYLKRLLVGGLDRVYEIGKCFRNEGVSTSHNPEFTMLEVYRAYADYRDMMDLAERLVCESLGEALGVQRVEYAGETIDLSPPWRRVGMLEAVTEATGIDLSDLSTEAILGQASERGIDLAAAAAGKLVEVLFERYVEPSLIQPTFVCDYPADISPLAKRKADDPRLVERFELFAGGIEVANAFSELNDPVDQRSRFEAQERLRAAGDEEAQRIDEDFLFAIEHGMPPAGGMGVGIDRLAMLASGSESIRDVILFPALRRREG